MEQPEDFKKIQKYYSNLYCGCRLNFYSFFMLIIDRMFNTAPDIWESAESLLWFLSIILGAF